MAITFVNKGTWAAGTTSIAPGIPASMQAGDLMLLQVHTCNQAVTTPSGWTQVTGSPVSTGTANAAGGTRISMYYRFWQSGDAAPTVAVTGGTVTNGIIVGYRGVDQTTPFDATPVATTLATASTTLTMTGITTATSNALIHWGIARDQDLNSTTAVTAFTNANLTGITEVHDQVVNTGVGGGVWTGYGFKGTAGATGNLTITQTSSIAVGLTIALRKASFTTTGTLTGQGSAIAGSADRQSPAVTHDTSGALSAGSGSISGSASRFRAFSSTGDLAGQGSTVTGSADRQDAPTFVTHDTSGSLSGQLGSVAGSATRFRAHPTSGTLSGQIGSVVGSATRFRAHPSSGVLSGQGSSVVGAAFHSAKHTTTGALSGQIGGVSGAADTATPRPSSGALVGPGSVVSGSASRTGATVTHDASGALSGQLGSVAGSASRTRVHPTSGVLGGGEAIVVGAANRAGPAVTHSTSGALQGQGAAISGAASRAGGATLTATQALMVADIWRRLGLDASSPLTETQASALFGGVMISKSGASSVVSTRTGPQLAVADVGLAIEEVWRRLGLDPAAPMTASATQITAGSIVQNTNTISGGLVVTRQ